MKTAVFALIDCNNFFVSCERIFRPDLRDKPVVVLSSNDGCVVARSNEVKALGIPMAAPAFKYKDIFRQHGVVQFSANFELYGDISRRITDVLTTVTPRIEIYSVDESFLDLSELRIRDYTAWGRRVREAIWRWVGVPVSIGIAPTKTLAKLASDRAKKDPKLDGILSLQCVPVDPATHCTRTDLAQEGSMKGVNLPSKNRVKGPSLYILNMSKVSVEEVWGVGWRLASKLRAENIHNAWQLSQIGPRFAQQLMGIHGRRLVTELNGTSCYPLELESKPRQSIARTRTFGRDTNDLNSIEAAIATFAAKAAFRLRQSRQVTRRAALFLATNKHKPGYQRWSRELKYGVPTADSGTLIASLLSELNRLYNPAHNYYRAGVLLYDFLPADALQTDLFGQVNVAQETAAAARMSAIDGINEKYGRETLRYASEDLGTQWKPRYNLRSPRYTSRWNELSTVEYAYACNAGIYNQQ